MALLFFHSPEEPARCALEISRTLQGHPHIQLRMGVHSGPVNQSPMLMTRRTSREQGSMWRNASWIAAMPGIFFCPGI